MDPSNLPREPAALLLAHQLDVARHVASVALDTQSNLVYSPVFGPGIQDGAAMLDRLADLHLLLARRNVNNK